MKTSCLYSAESYKGVDLWPHEGEQNRITMKKKLQTRFFSQPEKALSWCQNAVALTDLLHGEAYRMKGWMCETKRLRRTSKQSKPNHKREYLIVFISKSKKQCQYDQQKTINPMCSRSTDSLTCHPSVPEYTSWSFVQRTSSSPMEQTCKRTWLWHHGTKNHHTFQSCGATGDRRATKLDECKVACRMWTMV